MVRPIVFLKHGHHKKIGPYLKCCTSQRCSWSSGFKFSLAHPSRFIKFSRVWKKRLRQPLTVNCISRYEHSVLTYTLLDGTIEPLLFCGCCA